MDLLQLRYFQTVARYEHVTQAARELAIAQPSLSQTIARLEEELGVPLFDREGRQIRLNQFGRAFLRHVERIFTELEDGRRELADLAGLEQGRVALSIFSTPLLADLLSAFRAEYPRVSFRLLLQHTSSTREIEQQLERGEADLCITMAPIERSDITWLPLFTEELYLLVPLGHPLVARQRIELREVAQDTFIGLEPGTIMRDLTDSFCRQAGFLPLVAFEGDDPSTISGLVGAGLGVGFISALSWAYYQTYNARARAACLQIAEPRCQRTIGLAWHKTHYLSHAARAFRSFVEAYCQRLEQDQV
jgi:DNA-binding transcriptional LysR family regulator